MTKEELEKEARKDVDSLNGVDLVSSTMIAIDKYGAYKIGRYDGYLAGAEPREKRIVDLEKENTELKKKWMQATDEGTSWAHRKSLERENSELKELIKNIIRVTWGEGWNYSLGWKVKAEQFLNSEVEK